jgi:hypothetical protein
MIQLAGMPRYTDASGFRRDAIIVLQALVAEECDLGYTGISLNPK